MIIAPNGVSEQCVILSSSGNEVINTAVCNFSMKRLRFKRPISAHGEPTYGIWQRKAVLLPPGSPIPQEAEVFSNFKLHLPSLTSLRKSAEMRAIVSVDENGNLIGCAVMDRKTGASLIQQVCSQVKAVWRPAQEKKCERYLDSLCSVGRRHIRCAVNVREGVVSSRRALVL